MSNTDLKSRLAAHRALGHAPAAEHAWLATHGTFQTYEAGAVVNPKGSPAPTLMIVFSGRLVIRGDRGAGSHKMIEWQGGDVGGALPYSRGATPPSDAIAEEGMEALAIPRELFPELIRACPAVTAALVHTMIDRARHFTSDNLRDEKLVSLGKLAAGLAHELNNPASAVVRSAKFLGQNLTSSGQAARRLMAARLSDAQLDAVDAVRRRCSEGAPTPPLSAVALADREEAISDWLAKHGTDESFAAPLSGTNVSPEALEGLAQAVGGETLGAVLQWLSAECLSRTLSGEIGTAASRVYDLVAAVKGFSFMDRAPALEPVDVRSGVSDTLMMLAGKTRLKSVEISVEIPDGLPRAYAVGAELNQVWMNLIDNALDAVAAGGHIAVTATSKFDRVIVNITDDGEGIPREMQGRIFDPFFTTKGVGNGTGLGLDIVRRLLQRHDGSIAVESVPGRTEFQVRLPVAH